MIPECYAAFEFYNKETSIYQVGVFGLDSPSFRPIFLQKNQFLWNIVKKDLIWIRPLNTRIDLVQQHLQLGFLTKQMLWTDSQSIENETIGSKEYMHDLRETFRQNVFGSFHQNHSRFYLNKLLALVVITGDCNTCRPGFGDHSIKNATKPTFYGASHLEN